MKHTFLTAVIAATLILSGCLSSNDPIDEPDPGDHDDEPTVHVTQSAQAGV
jgi:predicted component of type VI protein secretion system